MAKKDKKNKKANFPMPPFPPMPFPVPVPPMDMSAGDPQKEVMGKAMELTAGAKAAWGKALEMKKATADSSKDQFAQFFAYMMEMQDGFAETLPEQLPTLPGMPEVPVSPKALMKALKEFEEMANDYFIKQIDSCIAFRFEVQEKAMEKIPEAQEAAEGEEAAADEAAEEATEENAE